MGKTVVIVRANIGLEFEASKHFAGMNPERTFWSAETRRREKRQFFNDTGYSKAEL